MYKGEERNPVTILILSMVTCMVYNLLWLFQASDELNKALGREEFNPMIVLLTSLLCPFATAFWAFKMTRALPELAQTRGLPGTDNELLLLVLMIFVPPAGLMMFQTELNRVWRSTPAY